MGSVDGRRSLPTLSLASVLNSQRDQHFLAELAGAEQHDFGGVGRQGGSEGGHGQGLQTVALIYAPRLRLATGELSLP